MLAMEDFRFGLEHEFAVVDAAGRFCDFGNTSFDELDRVIADLPWIESDYPGLRVGDLGIKERRWYIEGFERFSERGEYLRTEPKGFEIRTPICSSLEVAVETLAVDLARWEVQADRYGYRRARTALNPFRAEYVPVPPLNVWELAQRRTPEERTAHVHMLTYGPDISFSHPALSPEETIDIAKKLTFYSPFIVPFSFSSPFYVGEAWGGYSRRTWYRTGLRPAVLVFVGDQRQVIASTPTLVDAARLAAEVGRVEFKAFDCLEDVESFRALGALVLGLALDHSLPGRALVPDGRLHRHVATTAFSDPPVYEGACRVLEAAREALPEEWRGALAPLQSMLTRRITPAHAMLRAYEAGGDIVAAVCPAISGVPSG